MEEGEEEGLVGGACGVDGDGGVGGGVGVGGEGLGNGDVGWSEVDTYRLRHFGW